MSTRSVVCGARLAAGLVAAIAVAALPAPSSAAPGALDASFDADGIAAAAYPGRIAAPLHVLEQPDGKLVTTGASTRLSLDALSGHSLSLDWRVAPAITRYSTNGALDTSFGEDGRVSIYLNNHMSIAIASALQPDGRIVVVGTSLGYIWANTFVTRLNVDGSVDQSFGTGGTTTLLPQSLTALVPRAVTVQADGSILIAATSLRGDVADYVDSAASAAFSSLSRTARARRSRQPYAETDVALVRLTSNGDVDGSFGDVGTRLFDALGAGSDEIVMTAIPAMDGGLLVSATGFTKDLTRAWPIAMRFTADGDLDSDFGGGDGIIAGPRSKDGWEVAFGAIEAPDGDVLVGTLRTSVTDDTSDLSTRVTRYHSSGNVDTTYGTHGHASYQTVRMTSIVSGSNDSIYAIGSGQWDAHDSVRDEHDVAVLRLTADGRADRIFDHRGVALVDLDSKLSDAGDSLDTATHGTRTADGRVVVAAFGGMGHSVLRLRGDADGGADDRSTLHASLFERRRGVTARWCGSRARPCRVGRRDAVVLRGHVRPMGDELVGAMVTVRLYARDVDVSEPDGGADEDIPPVATEGSDWVLERQRRATIDARGRFTLSVPSRMLRGGHWRARFRLPAGATAVSAFSDYHYFTVVGRVLTSGDEEDGVDLADASRAWLRTHTKVGARIFRND